MYFIPKRLKSIFILLFLTVLPVLLNCSNDSEPSVVDISFEGIFSKAGLDGIAVNTLNHFEGNMYAATDNGLYRRPEVSENLFWSSLGLQKQNVLQVAFLPETTLLAAIGLNFINEGEPTLFLSHDDGQNWQPWVNNYGGETGEYTFVASLVTPSKPSDTLFALGADRTVVRSLDGGKTWGVLTGQWDNFGGSSQSVYINSFQKEIIWAVGASALGTPYILKSADYGESWMSLDVLENIEAVCYDVITHPKEQSHILAGLGGGFDQALVIRKSTDGGANWETVEFGDSPAQMQVNDMVSVLENGKEVLYFATNQGVYSYAFEE